MPTLRECRSDLSLLFGTFRGKVDADFELTTAARLALVQHRWEGNVRELKSVLEFSAYTGQDGQITEANLPENIGKSTRRGTLPRYDRVREYEKTEILRTLEFYGTDLKGKKAAAKELGISLASLYAKLK